MAKRILIIEDDTFLGEVLVHKCSAGGFESAIVTDGKAGLDMIREWNPDIILLDIILPIMNGYDVLRAKKADPKIANIPVIIVTNSGDQNELSELSNLGVREFLVKARFDPDEILNHVRKIIGDSNDMGDKSNAVSDIPNSDNKDKIDSSPVQGISEINPVTKKSTLSDSVENSKISSSDVSLQKKKIMWVEDDKFLSDLISRKLYLLGCNVVYAETGEIALTMIEREMPDIVLLDILLPGMTGIEVLEKIKKNSKTSKIPVMMLSNFSQESDIKKCFSLGAEKYLVKATVTLDEIVEEIKRILQSEDNK